MISLFYSTTEQFILNEIVLKCKENKKSGNEGIRKTRLGSGGFLGHMI
jgi:hypothetical protein